MWQTSTSNNYIMVNNNYLPLNPSHLISSPEPIDATNSSSLYSTRKEHLRNFNKSGYQVKHSMYGKPNLF